MKELAESPSITAFRQRFEAGRSFDLDDDLEFCPCLLTEDDVCNSTPSLLSEAAWPDLEITVSDTTFPLVTIHPFLIIRSLLVV